MAVDNGEIRLHFLNSNVFEHFILLASSLSLRLFQILLVVISLGVECNVGGVLVLPAEAS